MVGSSEIGVVCFFKISSRTHEKPIRSLFYFLLCFVLDFPTSHHDTRVAGNTGPELSSLLADGAGDGRALHLTLGVDDDTSVVLEVEEDTVESLPGLGLADDNGGVDLLSQLGLSLLDGGHDHVANTAGGQAVEAGTETLDGDDVEVTGTRVVGAVHDGTNGKTEGHLELATRGTTGELGHCIGIVCGVTSLKKKGAGPSES
jgi:hypothetical protein